jgi:hypothetical protein
MWNDVVGAMPSSPTAVHPNPRNPAFGNVSVTHPSSMTSRIYHPLNPIHSLLVTSHPVDAMLTAASLAAVNQ